MTTPATPTTATDAPTPATRSRPPARRLRPRVRKGVLVVHVLAAGAWIGLDVALGVLVVTALLSPDPAVVALAVAVLPLVGPPLLVAGLACLVSGVALGLGTHLGLLRYRWVAVKLALTVVLVTLVSVLLLPGLDAAARAGAAGTPPDVSSLVMPPLVSGTALVVATVLSIYRPWGRVRAGRG